MGALRRGFASEALVRTPFFALHEELGGQIVPFAGYELPVQFKGIKDEHLHTRAAGCAGLFDVSHMGQIRWDGADRCEFLERVVCGGISELEEGTSVLSLITNETGGIIDDTVITNAGDFVYMVVNGACKHGDMAHFKEQMEKFDGDVSMEYLGEEQLVALQGPGAAEVLAKLTDLDVQTMPFMFGKPATVAGIEGCRVTRCGYTGEDGYEIGVPPEHADALARTLLSSDAVEPAGLGARDSLRLEAGLCLYGHDLDTSINPVEAALTWTIGGPKTRRRKEQGFLGASGFLQPDGKLIKQTQKRVGFGGMRAPAREGAEVYSEDGETLLGRVTSGTFGPSLKKPIAMGYIATASAKVGTKINISVRGKMQPAEVTNPTFIETNYYRKA